MNFNLLKKSTGGHFDKLRGEYAKLSQQIAANQEELTKAEADFRAKDQTYRQSVEQSKQSRFSPSGKNLLSIRNQAEQHFENLKIELGDLQSRHRSMQWKVEAPTKMREAKATYQRLTARRIDLQAELEKTGDAAEKIQTRITGLEQRTGEETKDAVAVVADGGELPEGFGKIDAELRVTRAALIKVQERAEDITAELQALREQCDEARNTYVGSQAAVAELELAEQLPSFVGIIARASVAKHLSQRGHNPDKYVIEIPRTVVDAMYESLNAELAA
jgi:chromosome segregation ATPase